MTSSVLPNSKQVQKVKLGKACSEVRFLASYCVISISITKKMNIFEPIRPII